MEFKSILVVDDDIGVRRLTLAALQSAGFSTLEANDGDTGLSTFRQHCENVQLILTDIVMPRVSGITLAEQVMEIAPSVRIMFMSGFSDAKLPTKEGRKFSVLAKPFTASQLIFAVEECLATCA